VIAIVYTPSLVVHCKHDISQKVREMIESIPCTMPVRVISLQTGGTETIEHAP
jgi:hypothetical protein